MCQPEGKNTIERLITAEGKSVTEELTTKQSEGNDGPSEEAIILEAYHGTKEQFASVWLLATITVELIWREFLDLPLQRSCGLCKGMTGDQTTCSMCSSLNFKNSEEDDISAREKLYRAAIRLMAERQWRPAFGGKKVIMYSKNLLQFLIQLYIK